jgi:hypothetical protein
MDESGKFLKAAFLEVVDNQLESDEIPEVRDTLDRLVSEGYSEEEAREFIAWVVAVEIYCVQKYDRKFARDKYLDALGGLPDFDEDDYEKSEEGYQKAQTPGKIPSKKKRRDH